MEGVLLGAASVAMLVGVGALVEAAHLWPRGQGGSRRIDHLRNRMSTNVVYTHADPQSLVE
jgi:hypothetical protein